MTLTLPAKPLDFGTPTAPHQGLGEMVSGLVGSEILRIAGEVRALAEKGQPVLNLTVGDFAPKQFRIPRELEQAIARALAAGQTNYPPSDGVPELKRAVTDFYRDALGLDYPQDGILIAGGARPLIYALFRAVLDPGEKVVYPVPSWNNNHYCHLAGAQGIAVETSAETGFQPTAECLAPHLGEARLLALNSPLNPAGTGFAREQLRAIAQLVVDENRRRGPGAKPLFLFYDQIYWLLAADSAPHTTPVELVPEVAPYTLMIDGISKAFAATGLRVGWAVGPPFLISRMKDFLGHVGAWAPRPEQIATAEIFADPALVHTLAGAIREGINVRLAALDRGLKQLAAKGYPVKHLPPTGALYQSVHFDLIRKGGQFENNRAVRQYLLEKAGFAVVPFHAFGTRDDNGWFRLSVGAVGVDEIAPAIDRVEAALAACLQ
jgi:aspartate aminotransferase